jgi:hypothetical protein
MTIDYNRNHYAKVGHYSNIVAEFDKERVDYIKGTPVNMCPFMGPLISKLALTHPEWMIVGAEPMWSRIGDAYTLQRFRIYAGTDNIGRIYRDGYYEQDFKYEIYNDRVEASRSKRGGMRTGDMKKALKAIDKFFAPKTVEERRAKATGEIGSHITNTLWRTNRALNELIQRITPALASYLTRNMAEIRPELESLGALAQVLDAIPDKFEICKGMWQIETARKMEAGTTVVLMGDRYMLIPDKDPMNPQVVTTSQLDPVMSSKIGVLKIFDKEDEAIEDVGMRYDANTFYILP